MRTGPRLCTVRLCILACQHASVELPVFDRFLHLIKALHSFIERVAGFDIGYENLPQQIKVLQIQRLAISRYDILDGQNIEWVNVRHDGRRFNSQSMDGEVF